MVLFKENGAFFKENGAFFKENGAFLKKNPNKTILNRQLPR